MKRIISVSMILSLLALFPFPAVSFADGTDDLITYEKPADAFDYSIDEDPMQITDEEFFGAWSETAQSWIQKPYFSYGKYSGLSAVEDAVKRGNYAEAKDALLEYYRSVQEERSLAPMSHPGATAVIRTQALEKNVYAVSEQNGLAQGFFNVDNDWEEHRIDVLSSFSAASVGRDAYRGFVLMSVDKHRTQAEFYSRESQYAPTLELVVNGMAVSIPACKDAMVRGGAYGARNYGKDAVMTVQESGEYQDFNDNTMRAYIAFDVSSLKTTDTVTSATLVLRGRNASGTGEKEIFVYRLNDMSFDENTIAFNDYTDCMLWSCNDQNTWDYVTSASTNVKGKACFFHRGNELLVPAELYRYTGNESYAYTFIRQHMGMVNHVGFNRSVFNELDLARQLDTGTESLMHVIQSTYMTGDILAAMLKTFWLQADYLVNVYYGTATNNWGSFATCGVYAFLARFSEFEVYDSWMEKTTTENTRLVGGFTFDDGMCIELSQSYIMTILNTLYTPVSIFNATGVKLPYTDEVMKQAKNIVSTLINCSSPGFKGYNIADGNDYTSSIAGTVQRWYPIFSEDPAIAYVATDGQYGSMPENATTHYPAGLRTYMRSSWDDDALAMSFTAIGNGSHGHYDKLSVTMYAYGKFLLTDQAYGGVLTGDIRNYMISAQQHNLVTIDGQNQSVLKADGEELAYESNELYDFIEYGGEMVTGSYQSRNILFLKKQKLWIIGDYAAPGDKETVHSYEQHWHMLPSANMTVDDTTKVIESHFNDYNVTLVPIAPEELAARQEATIFSGAGGTFEDSKKTVLQKSQSGDAVFSTIVLPRDLNEDFDVDTEVLNTGIDKDLVNAFHSKVRNLKTNAVSQYYYYHLNDPSQKRKVNVGRFSTDAETMLIQTDEKGNVLSVFVMNATVLEDSTLTDKVLFYSETPVAAFAYEPNGDFLVFSSSSTTEQDMEHITVYAAGKQAAKLNGSRINCAFSGGYMYFGAEPIIEGSEETPSDTQKPSQSEPRPSGGAPAASASPGTETPSEPLVPVVPASPSYEDVSDGDWFSGYVEELTEKGIVSGDGSGNFAPHDYVTREQFVKMLMLAAGAETDEAENTFEDVSDGDWFKPYVLTSKKLGIVTGISETRFGIGENITRQDMAVMISRVIEKLEIGVETQETEAFADAGQVSDYAAQAVGFMKSIGLIEGYNNEFRPLEYLTRAESAKVISDLLALIEKPE